MNQTYNRKDQQNKAEKPSLKKKLCQGAALVAQQVTNLSSIHKDVGSIPGFAHWVKDLQLP